MCDFPAPYSCRAVLPMVRYIVALRAFADPEQGTVHTVEVVRLHDTLRQAVALFLYFLIFFRLIFLLTSILASEV